MMRMRSAPVSAAAFIAGYIFPLLPVALAQSLVCFAVALLLGAELSVYMLLALIVLLPAAVLYISACIAESSKSNTTGNPMPNVIFSGSLRISFPVLTARIPVFIIFNHSFRFAKASFL